MCCNESRMGIKYGLFLSICLGFLLFSSLNLITATDIASEGTAERKLQRGFLNIALAPMEISHQLTVESKEERFGMNWVTGMLRGTLFTAGRSLVGAYELVTAALPHPANYEPAIKPEFPWEHFGDSKMPS